MTGCVIRWILGGAALFAAAAIVLERRLENTPEFPLGFLIGELAVLLTVGLNCVTLIAGGETRMADHAVAVGDRAFAVRGGRGGDPGRDRGLFWRG